MKISDQELLSVQTTLGEMHRLANQYAMDVAPYAGMPLRDFFDLVAKIPYHVDTWKGEPAEVVKRPSYTLRQLGAGGDCDDKAIVMASWAVLNHLPYRFIAAGRILDGPLHHVFTEIFYGGKWVPVDSTYPRNVFGIRQWQSAHEVVSNGPTSYPRR